jgi:hypothetical protein
MSEIAALPEGHYLGDGCEPAHSIICPVCLVPAQYMQPWNTSSGGWNLAKHGLVHTDREARPPVDYFHNHYHMAGAEMPPL